MTSVCSSPVLKFEAFLGDLLRVLTGVSDGDRTGRGEAASGEGG